MTLVEALACGTQVVCYDATAMPEIVTDEVGEVVPLGRYRRPGRRGAPPVRRPPQRRRLPRPRRRLRGGQVLCRLSQAL